ncbi:MAG: hypothetical protein AABW85_04960 [archaeon]
MASNGKPDFSKMSFRGSSPPGVFVSWNNYPNLTIAPFALPRVVSDAGFLDDPQKWFGLPKQKIVSMRGELIMGTTGVKAGEASNPSYKIARMQELFMSLRPVDVGMELLSVPKTLTEFSEFAAPLGPKAPLKKLELNESPSVDKKVDYIVGDSDAKTSDSLEELYGADYSVGFISKLLSAGLLGAKKERKFVPTRWSLTATDDIIGRQLIEGKVKFFPQAGGIEIFSTGFLGNRFFVLIVPAAWSFEQLEAWGAGSQEVPSISADFEFFSCRKNYASNVAGAYYAARLAVAEFLVKKKQQAAAIVFREISPEYKASLGVWVIRESVRNALKQKPLEFGDLQLALKFLESRLSLPIKNYLKKSALIDFLLHQKKLEDF